MGDVSLDRLHSRARGLSAQSASTSASMEATSPRPNSSAASSARSRPVGRPTSRPESSQAWNGPRILAPPVLPGSRAYHRLLTAPYRFLTGLEGFLDAGSQGRSVRSPRGRAASEEVEMKARRLVIMFVAVASVAAAVGAGAAAPAARPTGSRRSMHAARTQGAYAWATTRSGSCSAPRGTDGAKRSSPAATR